jgi:membrane-associated phospholipid phosphatase
MNVKIFFFSIEDIRLIYFRLSFPSLHAALSMYSAVFLAVDKKRISLINGFYLFDK